MTALLLLAPLASAGSWSPSGQVGVFTSFPTDIGVRGTFEGPGRLRLTGSAGWMPRAYLDAVNEVATDQGWYAEEDAALVEAALDDALVLRLHLGWRPLRRAGLQLEAGYGWIGLGGGLTGAEILEDQTGYDLEWLLGDGYAVSADASLRRVEASLGWEHPLGEHLLLRWDLGASYTAAAEARLEPDFELGWPFEEPVEKALAHSEAELERTLEEDIHTPILAIGLGWRFP